MLTENLEYLKKAIITFSFHTQEMIELSIKGLMEKKKDILAQVMTEKETIANKLEIEIEELCITIIARYDPKAVDLRSVLMAMKINNDLERIADHAVNICGSSLKLIANEEHKADINLPLMAVKAVEMLKNSITAYIEEDAELANSVLKEDDILDDYHHQIKKELLSSMVKEHTDIGNSFLLMKISHDLERIGDLSTNICEDIIYMVEAKVIKHNLAKEK